MLLRTNWLWCFESDIHNTIILQFMLLLQFMHCLCTIYETFYAFYAVFMQHLCILFNQGSSWFNLIAGSSMSTFIGNLFKTVKKKCANGSQPDATCHVLLWSWPTWRAKSCRHRLAWRLRRSSALYKARSSYFHSILCWKFVPNLHTFLNILSGPCKQA